MTREEVATREWERPRDTCVGSLLDVYLCVSLLSLVDGKDISSAFKGLMTNLQADFRDSTLEELGSHPRSLARRSQLNILSSPAPSPVLNPNLTSLTRSRLGVHMTPALIIPFIVPP